MHTSTPHVDYDKQVRSFCWRTLRDSNKALWLRLFEQYLGLGNLSRVVDIGCGTGRFAELIAGKFKCTVVGVDLSLGMLSAVKEKKGNYANWCQATVENLPFANESFDVCFSSFVIHHIQDKPRALAEVYRTLCNNGRVGIRYLSHEQLYQDPLYRFFPAALEIDLQRAPSLSEIRALLQHAGFICIEEKILCQTRAESAQEYLNKLRNRYTSSLALLSEEEYQCGVEKATSHFATHDLDESEREQEITFLVYGK